MVSGIGASDDALSRVVRYHRPARPGEPPFSSLSFTLEDGAWAWLVGPTGQRSDPTLDSILDLSPPPEGRLEVFGQDARQSGRSMRRRLRRRIGLVRLQPDPFIHLPVLAATALPAWAAAGVWSNAERQSREILSWLGLDSRRNALVHALDLDGRWRVALARALVNAPQLVLAEEPGRDLAPALRKTFLGKLQEANAAGMAVLATVDEASLPDGFIGSAIRVPPQPEIAT